MKKFIVFFREPDGRKESHQPEEIRKHQENWQQWFKEWIGKGLNGGSGLTLDGVLIKGRGDIILHEVHQNGNEIIGGYVLLNTENFDTAITIMKSCPVYEFGGYAEIRELQNQN